jgi:hypothetical protein
MPTPDHLLPYLELLATEGFRPTVEGAEEGGSEAFLLFKYEGSKFTLQPDQRDATFFLIKIAYQSQPHSQEVLLRIANDLNHGCKVVKALIEADGGAAFTFEAFVDDVARAGPLLLKGLGALAWASSQFFERLEKEEGGATEEEGAPERPDEQKQDGPKPGKPKEYVN